MSAQEAPEGPVDQGEDDGHGMKYRQGSWVQEGVQLSCLTLSQNSAEYRTGSGGKWRLLRAELGPGRRAGAAKGTSKM